MTTAIEERDLETRLYSDGAFVPALGGATFETRNPANGQVLASISAAQAEDVDRAVRAAHRQFESGAWSRMPGAERGRLLNRLADLIERDKDKIAALEAIDNGKPVGMAANADLPNTIDTFRYFAGWADKLEGRTVPTSGAFGRPVFAYTIREPLGVIAGISAYNAPTMYVGWKAAAALAAGNTIVIKPPEEAPLTTLYMARLFDEAGFPPGVFNVTPGLGPVAGMALARHPLVAKISFTGSGAVGSILAAEAAALMRPITLELGGKAPQIVCADADLQRAIPFLAMGFIANQGQICAAGTRVLVHRSLVDKVAEALAAAANAQRLGDPLDPDTTMGPLTTERSVARIASYVSAGRNEGAALVAGGNRPAAPGWFHEPTVFIGHNDMKIAQEEIFGPVVTIIPFDTIDEAVTLANATRYGLNAGIFTTDLALAHVTASRIRTGAVWINGWGLIDARLPWGGIKASGYGRENGFNGIEDVTHEKVVTALL